MGIDWLKVDIPDNLEISQKGKPTVAEIEEQDSELRESTDQLIQDLQDHVYHVDKQNSENQEPVKQTAENAEESVSPRHKGAEINTVVEAANAAIWLIQIKTRGRTRAPKAEHPQMSRWSPHFYHVNFQAENPCYV